MRRNLKSLNISQQVDLLLSHLDWWMALLPLPFLITSFLDVVGWRRLLPDLVRVPLTSLISVQVSAESVLQTVPGGFAFSDALKVLVLKRRFNMVPFDMLGSLVIRHWMIGLTQILYILIALAFGILGTQHLMAALVDQQTALFASIGLLVGITLVLGLLVRALVRGALASSVWNLLSRLPIQSLRGWLGVRRNSFDDADTHFKTLGSKSRWTLLLVLGLYFLVWAMETIETLFVAHIVGFPLNFVAAFVLEAILSAVKLAVFFLPSGIGAKDLGYFALFASLSVGATTVQIGSFVILKRLIFFFWMAIGYLFLLSQGVRPMFKRENPRPTVVETR